MDGCLGGYLLGFGGLEFFCNRLSEWVIGDRVCGLIKMGSLIINVFVMLEFLKGNIFSKEWIRKRIILKGKIKKFGCGWKEKKSFFCEFVIISKVLFRFWVRIYFICVV